MIYIADLGRWLNIRPDSEFVDLLWKINDAREHAILRAEFVLSPEIVRRTVTPGMMSYTYYFVSPRTAAGVFARDLDESSPRLGEFYDRRDTIIIHHSLYGNEWYNNIKFEVLDATLPTAPALSSSRPVLAFPMKLTHGGYVLREDKNLVMKMQTQHEVGNNNVFVEDD